MNAGYREQRIQVAFGALYQIIGHLAAEAGIPLDDPQVAKALDYCLAASGGDIQPPDGLLPFDPKP